MPRPRERDSRSHPEQSARIKRAMWWARVESASQLHERVDWGWSPRTTTSRVEGDTELTLLERQALAKALGVHPDVLRPGGPELPDPDEPAVLVATVTGSPGSWTVKIVRPGEVPVEIRYEGEEPPSPFPG